jgi:hypothetical protein
MTRRVWAITLFLGFAALFLSANHASAQTRPQAPHKCPHSLPICPADTPAPTNPATDSPTVAVTDPPTERAEVLSLAQPTTTPPLVPDSGSAQSATFLQSSDSQDAALGTAAISQNNASFAAAPGFGPIGVPLILFFALLGLVSLAILKRI